MYSCCTGVGINTCLQLWDRCRDQQLYTCCTGVKINTCLQQLDWCGDSSCKQLCTGVGISICPLHWCGDQHLSTALVWGSAAVHCNGVGISSCPLHWCRDQLLFMKRPTAVMQLLHWCINCHLEVFQAVGLQNLAPEDECPVQTAYTCKPKTVKGYL